MKPFSFILAVGLSCVAALTQASDMDTRPGWAVHPTDQDHASLVKSLTAAVKEHGMIVVTRAGPTKAAAKRGITIPGNMVVGVYNNDFAVRVLATSTAAMIEAPIRFYVTENTDGTATLSYKTPSTVFAPYMDEGGDALQALAAELDAKFAEIAADAVD
ncbi:MAG: DUF302 domain-containing protein [Paracoccaceae bacterium]